MKQPSNGPSPSATKFNPKFEYVKTSAPKIFNSTQHRFATDKETILEIRRKVGNPRLDECEGEHTLIGEHPNCQTCSHRRSKVERNWIMAPLRTSIYAKHMHNSTLQKSVERVSSRHSSPLNKKSVDSAEEKKMAHLKAKIAE